ncbi:MAG: TIM-barrel domain-containing protein [Steroidobacteraceae bacterium]
MTRKHDLVAARTCRILWTALLALATTVAASAGALEVQSGLMHLQISAIADDILRVRIAPTGTFPEDASWVVPAALRDGSVDVHAWSSAGAEGFDTSALSVRVERATLRLTVTDRAGHVISADAPEHAIDTQGAAFTLRKQLAPDQHFFGLGDKTGPLDRRGQAFVNWNTDSYAFQESTDPIYKSVPFFIATGGAGGSYGVFLDNTWRSTFDFGKRDPGALAFGAAGGPIDYYLIYGPALKRVVERYTDLTGKAPLAPLWSLGFQQSRFSYMSDNEVRELAARFRKERIPADAIWLDIDYQDHYRPFTTNKQTFPDLADLSAALRRENFRLVAITDLHIADLPGSGYAPFDSGIAGDHFLKQANDSLYVGPVWPGPAVFPDFTRALTRAWWGELFKSQVAAGIAGFWNDMNEPAIFDTPSKTMPLDTVHRIDEPGFAPRAATHAEIHNIYGMENSRATYEGLRQLAPDERAYVMTRASFAGGQRYAVTWTGDNSSTWNHLKLSVAMLLNLGMSGFGYSGADVGGYIGAPSPELLTRWIELGAFMPVFRDHFGKGDVRKEPWVDGPAHTAIRKHFIEERYRLLPYIYALAEDNARSGAPLMRPVFYDFPEALSAPCGQDTTFMLGDRLLIAPPPVLESPAPYTICLPAGRWFDYWSGADAASLTRGVGLSGEASAAAERTGLVLTSMPSLERLPVFVRAGTILPRQPLTQSTAQIPQGPLSLDVYPGDNCVGEIYQDDGHSMGFTRGEYLRQRLLCEVRDDGIAITFGERDGHFHPWWRQLRVTVHDWQGAASVRLGDHEMPVIVNVQARTATVLLDDAPHATQLLLRRAVHGAAASSGGH